MEETKFWLLSERHKDKYNSNEIVWRMRTDFRKKDYFFLEVHARLKLAFSAVPERMLFVTRRKIQLAFTKTTLGMVAKTGRLSKRHILKTFRKSRLRLRV